MKNHLKNSSFPVLILMIATLFSCGDDNEVVNSMTISFEKASLDAVENSSNSINIPLKLEGTLNKEVFVTYEVSGTADFPGDVTPLTSTTFLIPAGASAFNIEMMVIEDAILETEAESLMIELVSVSDGGNLGQQTTFELKIAEEVETLVSFVKRETNVTVGKDVSIELVLSQAYSKDLIVRVSSDIESYDDGSFFGESIFDVESDDVIIPAGETTATFDLTSNMSEFNAYIGNGGVMTISSVSDENRLPLEDVNPDELKDSHVINIVEGEEADDEGTLEVEIDWTSSNEDVDIDLYLIDEDGNIILSSESGGFDNSESFVLDKEVENGDYLVVVSWYEGTGTADIILSFTPTGNATWGGSNEVDVNTYEGVTKSDIDTQNVFALINKNGPDYE